MPTLDAAFRRASPRLNPKPIAPLGAAVMALVTAIWIAALAAAFASDSLAAWGIGIAFLIYDVGQLAFVAFQARKLWRVPQEPDAAARSGGPQTAVAPHGGLGTAAPVTAGATQRPSLGVIVAAYNEAPALRATIDAILNQTDPPELVLIADDGSDDDSAEVLAAAYALRAPAPGGASEPSPLAPALRWLRLPHRGKAAALNAALGFVQTDVFVTVDADTLLGPDALAEIRAAFANDPSLAVGGGVLQPRCPGGLAAFALQSFQRYEYVRNFLGRFAWSELDSLLLISGAFAAFRTEAVKAVGGFDTQSLVEDYELIHRLHRRAREAGKIARVRIVGGAVASTDAPATLSAFLNQRRRWFAGFLQTQYWNRDMIGAPRYGALGLAMLPFKCLDAAAPLYGLTALALALGFAATGQAEIALPVGGLALGKIGFDFINMAYSLAAYRRWTGGRFAHPLWLAALCLLVEPLTFQPLRHLGAARGWVSLLAGRMEWGRASRPAIEFEAAD